MGIGKTKWWGCLECGAVNTKGGLPPSEWRCHSCHSSFREEPDPRDAEIATLRADLDAAVDRHIAERNAHQETRRRAAALEAARDSALAAFDDVHRKAVVATNTDRLARFAAEKERDAARADLARIYGYLGEDDIEDAMAEIKQRSNGQLTLETSARLYGEAIARATAAEADIARVTEERDRVRERASSEATAVRPAFAAVWRLAAAMVSDIDMPEQKRRFIVAQESALYPELVADLRAWLASPPPIEVGTYDAVRAALAARVAMLTADVADERRINAELRAQLAAARSVRRESAARADVERMRVLLREALGDGGHYPVTSKRDWRERVEAALSAAPPPRAESGGGA